MEAGTVDALDPSKNPSLDADVRILMYHVLMLEDAGFLTRGTNEHGFAINGLPLWLAWRITWQGQEWLASTRDPDIWQKVKKRFGESLNTLTVSAIAEVAAGLVKAKWGLP